MVLREIRIPFTGIRAVMRARKNYRKNFDKRNRRYRRRKANDRVSERQNVAAWLGSPRIQGMESTQAGHRNAQDVRSDHSKTGSVGRSPAATSMRSRPVSLAR